MNMRPNPFVVTRLAPSASLAQALAVHWREYLMEAAELAVLMFFICAFGTLIYSYDSPIKAWALSSVAKSFFMGIGVAATTLLIIRSPFGRRTGAHFNPAITLTYFYLDQVHRWDALYYIASQFAGALLGVQIARELFGQRLSAPPVCYVITTPGKHGEVIAFVAEFVLSGVLMGIVLFATNHWSLAKLTPIAVSAITVFYYVLCPSLSGFSVNPARSFSSGMFAWVWQGIWVYFTAPCIGMLTAAAIYVRTTGPEKIYCAKVFHDLRSTCPFNCHLYQLYLQSLDQPGKAMANCTAETVTENWNKTTER